MDALLRFLIGAASPAGKLAAPISFICLQLTAVSPPVVGNQNDDE
jgi:hypothetical protein